MRSKVAGVLFATAMVLPFGLVACSAAGAVGGTTCSKASGTAKFVPALPKLGNPAKVKPTVTITNGKLAGCVGGRVTSATFTASLKFAIGSNCTTLSKGAASGAKGPEKITWNNKKLSTINPLSLTSLGPTKPTQVKATGPVTLGLFRLSKQSGTLNFKIPTDGSCTTKALTAVAFTQLTGTKLVIK